MSGEAIRRRRAEIEARVTELNALKHEAVKDLWDLTERCPHATTRREYMPSPFGDWWITCADCGLRCEESDWIGGPR